MRLGHLVTEWFSLTVCTALALLGLWLALARRERAGFAVAALFGGGAVVVAYGLLHRRRLREHAAADHVSVPGYLPLRRRRASLLAWTGGLAAVGIVMALTGSTAGSVLVWFGAALAVLGLGLSLLIALGVLPEPFLQFEVSGLRFGQRGYSFLLEWDNVADMAPAELHGHDLLLLTVRDVGRLCATLEPPSTTPDRVLKLLQSNQQWFGADMAVMAAQYGTDIALLAHAIRRYVTDPASRSELRERRGLPSSGR